VNGRLVEKLVDKGGYRPLLWRYRWDARSQLTGIETPDGERWEYKYDPFGRRISKRCTSHNKPGMDFHWNGDQLTDEIPVGSDGKPDDENAIRWIYEPGSFTPLARYEKGQLHYAVTDTVGRIQELLTEDGTIVWRGKQQLWGREESENDANISCRLRFPGQYEDEESGLYYNRFRYYDCEAGQYISPDPIGLAGGVNPYGYVGNPLKYIDPLGLCKTKYDNANYEHFFGEDKPWTMGATPDSMYTHIDPKTGKAIQNAIYDSNGNVIAHVDFKNHGIESGHYHLFPEPGNPASGHGPGKPHYPNSDIPTGWDKLPPGIDPTTPIGK